MKKAITPALTLLFLAAVLSLAGCKSSPAHFYTLTPIVSPEPKQAPGEAAGRLVVSVEPVEIPDYLDRPQIVTREGRNGLKISEFERWGGSLSENISSVLAEDLARILGTDHVFVNTSLPFEKADYGVTMRVLRLDLVPGEQVLMKAQWKVTSLPRKTSVSRVTSVSEKLSDKGYDTVVAAINRTVEQVSREIAHAIQSPPNQAESAPAVPAKPAP